MCMVYVHVMAWTNDIVRSRCLYSFVFLVFLGAVICSSCPEEAECLRENTERTPERDRRVPDFLNKLSDDDSLKRDGLPVIHDSDGGGRKCAPNEFVTEGRVGIAIGWSDLLQGFEPLSIFDGLGYYSPLDWIRNCFSRKQAVERQRPNRAEHRRSKRLFVFGDSLFDAGNNVYINSPDYLPANYPYGLAYFTNATGRISDGRLVPDFIAEFANLPLIPPSLKPDADFSYGANFASAESSVLDADDDAVFNVIDFKEQVENFKEMVGTLNATLGPNETRDVLGQAVYIFSIGGNDYGYYFEEAYEEDYNVTQSDQEDFVKIIVGNITEALIEMYEQGARKVAFQNVGPMGCLPEVESRYTEYNGTCVPLLLSLSLLHNKELYEALTSLAERLEGFKFSVMDYYHALYNRITDPTSYGFQVGRFPCYNSDDDLGNYTLCEYPSAYLFFNGGHTTQHANEQIAKLLWDGDPSFTRPYTVKQLFEEY